MTETSRSRDGGAAPWAAAHGRQRDGPDRQPDRGAAPNRSSHCAPPRDPELGTARWLPGSADGEALAVHVHRPSEGPVRAAIVLAPPVGREQVISYRTLRVLAIRAAARAGAVVLRPSWSGVGESTGRLPADPAGAWHEDLLRLIAAAREAAPGAAVSVIGLRLGAAVAAGALQHPEAAERTVLWEPVDGRRFVREHRALRRMSAGLPPAEGIELPGLSLSAEQAASLAALRLPSDQALHGRGDVSIVRAAAQDRVGAEHMYAVASRDARVPLEVLDRVISLAVPSTEERTAQRSSADASGSERHHAQTATAPAPELAWPRHWDSPLRDGLLAVRSEFVTIGPHRLPGVLTRPVPGQAPEAQASRPSSGAAWGRDGGPSSGQAAGLLLIAADAEPMDGPTGLWARTARELAGQGLVVLRAERRGIGEAGDPAALGEPMPYTEEAVEDTMEAVRWLRARVDGPVAAAGLCSGAWTALKSARQLDLAILLNSVAWTPDGDYYWRFYRDGAVQRLLGGRERLGRDPHAWRARLKQRLKTARRVVLSTMPLWQLRIAARTGQVQMLGQMLRDPSGLPPVDLHLGDGDRESFEMAGGQREVRALQRRGVHFRAMSLGDADHALLAESSRRRAVAALRSSLGLAHPSAGTASVRDRASAGG